MSETINAQIDVYGVMEQLISTGRIEQIADMFKQKTDQELWHDFFKYSLSGIRANPEAWKEWNYTEMIDSARQDANEMLAIEKLRWEGE